MKRSRWLVLILCSTALVACAQPDDPRPGPILAMEPRPNPPEARSAPRSPPARWASRFWEQLTPAQRRRVTERLREATPDRAPDPATVAQQWDVMGLADRRKLVEGREPVAPRQPDSPEVAAESLTVSDKGS
jgi:hypothetical protein